MKELFQKRQILFNQRCIKYLRYVFNDHFILVLLFLLGFLVVKYTELIHHFPRKNFLPLALVLLITFSMTFVGKIGSYIEPPDNPFLLPKDKFLQNQLQRAAIKSYFIWGGFQLLITLILSPIFLLSHWKKWQMLLYIIFLLLFRVFLSHRKISSYIEKNLLKFDKIIKAETQRQKNILRFFSLFTIVKGVSSTTKPRPYLNFLLPLLTLSKGKKVWLELYARAFLKNGDYFWLSVRLILITLVVGFSIPNYWGIALVALLNYLLLFQLITLFKVYDYQIMATFYPISNEQKVQHFQLLMKHLFLGITIIQLLFLIVNWQFIFLVLITILMVQFYLPLKLKKFID